MRQLPADKYNIAWFKLAECVSRGEKERALGVYRLLSHSLQDEAFIYQLEGDILLAFGDSAGAVQRYVQALNVYKQDGRLVEAAAIIEHIVQLTDEKLVYVQQLSALYSQLQMPAKAWECDVYAIRAYAGSGNFLQALQLLDSLVPHNVREQYCIRKELLFTMLKAPGIPRELILAQGHTLMELICLIDDRLESQQFFMELELADASLYTALVDETKTKL